MSDWKRMNISVPRPKKDSDDVYWHNIGSAFFKAGKTPVLVFDSLPTANNDGETKAMLFEAKPKQDAADKAHSNQEIDDEIPF